MSKKLAAIAVLALGMFIAAPMAANAQIPSGVVIHTEDEAPDATVTSEEVTDPEAVAYSTEDDGTVDDTVGSVDGVDPEIMQSGVGVEDRMLTTTEAPQNTNNTALIAGVTAGVLVLGAGSFFILRARKKN